MTASPTILVSLSRHVSFSQCRLVTCSSKELSSLDVGVGWSGTLFRVLRLFAKRYCTTIVWRRLWWERTIESLESVALPFGVDPLESYMKCKCSASPQKTPNRGRNESAYKDLR